MPSSASMRRAARSVSRSSSSIRWPHCWPFSDAALDAVILEVGLGGRLDAVNIVDADVALLTSIGLDHCDWLGDTLEAIGREKAGIFRAGRPAVLGCARCPTACASTRSASARRCRMPGTTSTCRQPAAGNGRRFRRDLPLPAWRASQLENAAAVLAVSRGPARAPAGDARSDRCARSARRRAAGPLPVRAGRRRSGSSMSRTMSGRPPNAWPPNLRHAAGRADDHWPSSAYSRTRTRAAIVAPLRAGVARWIAVDLRAAGPRRGRTCARPAAPRRCALRRRQPRSRRLASEAQHAAGEGDRVVVFGSFFTVGPASNGWRDDGAHERNRGMRPSDILARRRWKLP